MSVVVSRCSPDEEPEDRLDRPPGVIEEARRSEGAAELLKDEGLVTHGQMLQIVDSTPVRQFAWNWAVMASSSGWL